MCFKKKEALENSVSKLLYNPPKKDPAWKFSLAMQQVFWNFADKLPDNVDRSDLIYEKSVIQTIGEICVRVDKRDAYFHIFHDVSMSEIRQSALIAYWVLKFQPIRLENNAIIKDVNSRFAVFFVLSAVQEYARKKKKDPHYNLDLSKEYIDKLKYAAKYWDISKESMMLIAETIAEHVVTYKK